MLNVETQRQDAGAMPFHCFHALIPSRLGLKRFV
jgi:hypothetical protein